MSIEPIVFKLLYQEIIILINQLQKLMNDFEIDYYILQFILCLWNYVTLVKHMPQTEIKNLNLNLY